MTVSIRPLHPHFFGEVTGVDLRENARGGTVTKKEDYRLTSGLNDVSNLGKDGNPLPRDHRTHLFNLGNCLWHSDSSFRPIPAKFSLLSARVVNPKGGNTEFADMRAAYDALDDETKAEIEDLICEHSLMYSRGSLGFADYTEEEKQMFKPVRQRLVRTHPVHGRRSLQPRVNRHLRRRHCLGFRRACNGLLGSPRSHPMQFAPPRETRRPAQLVDVRTTDTPPQHPRRRPAEGSGSPGSTDPADDLVPRNPRRPFVVQVLEPTVELGSLGFRQRHSLGRLAEALPKLLDKLEPLGGRQLRDLQGRPRHALSIAGPCSTCKAPRMPWSGTWSCG